MSTERPYTATPATSLDSWHHTRTRPGSAPLSTAISPTLPTLHLGHKRYPVVLPRLSDPRLHLAAVIISIHVLGQTGLGFRVSVPQILAAIVVCALIEVAWTFSRTRQVVWPASALLTGSGVALILRVVGAERGDHWTWSGWYLFAVVAGLSLLTKYLIRRRGSHLFNPSNVGLVVAFLVLGSSRVEPLDFWWAPLNGPMAAAYVIILVGGLAITARLRLLGMAVTFWLTLATGLGLLAASGHCFTAAWSLAPVCGSSFFWVVITSPEVLIFLFFMITDPKTIPAGGAARIAFAACLALLSTLLIAPQSTEFGAKVALLAALVLMTPVRFLFDRALGGVEAEPSQLSTFVTRLTTARGAPLGPARIFTRGAIVGSVGVFVAVGIVAGGAPAREAALAAPTFETEDVAVEIDQSTLPPVTVSPDVMALNSDVVGGGFEHLAVIMAENLAVEGEAMLRGDQSLLLGVDSGERLAEMERRIDEAAAQGERVVAYYTFDSLSLQVTFADGPQGGASLGLEARGSVEEVTYDAGGVEQHRTTSPLATTFVLRQGSGDRWLIVDAVPLP
ncbi:MAG TPA: hypothetical protein VIL12_06780 [Acidimicrobiia bacterium]